MKKIILLLIVFGLFLLALAMRTPPRAPMQPPLTQTVDRIVIDKSDRQMTVFANGAALKTYRIALGFAPEGDKAQEGDGKTPEGTFRINRRNDQSKYHLSLGLDYPQPDDIKRARAAGVSPGGDIFIHGQPNSVADNMMVPGDWTAGCIAVTNAEIRELWDHVPMGTEVVVTP